MISIDRDRPDRISLNGVAKLSRKNVVVVGLLMYFGAMAFVFAVALILMVFRLEPGSHENASNKAPAIASRLRAG